MENLLKTISVIGGIIISLAALFGQPYLNFTTARRRRRIQSLINTDEIKEIINNCDTKFKENFINIEITESYFYSKTSILTNFNSIEKYIKLKNKLGLNYSWKSIKHISPFIRLDKKNATIEISKKENIIYSFLIIFSSATSIVSLLFLTSGSYLPILKTNKLIYSLIGFSLLIFSLLILISSTPYIQALHAKKRLELVLKLENKTLNNE